MKWFAVCWNQAGVSHELKTLLSVIQISASILQDCITSEMNQFYHFSQEDSFLKEREVGRWEMNWLWTRMAGSHLNCSTYINCYYTTWRMYVCCIIETDRNGGEMNDDQ
ncbi:hypothetical protein CN947_16595 [Bacillus cereus]|nr:hypothetical protein CN947_16595 [Bacillus cereus]